VGATDTPAEGELITNMQISRTVRIDVKLV